MAADKTNSYKLLVSSGTGTTGSTTGTGTGTGTSTGTLLSLLDYW
jgi:hypothetical protein